MKCGKVLGELDPWATDKGTFCEAVKGLLAENALVPYVECMCSLGMKDLDCLMERSGRGIKRECPEETNARIANMILRCIINGGPNGMEMTSSTGILH